MLGVIFYLAVMFALGTSFLLVPIVFAIFLNQIDVAARLFVYFLLGCFFSSAIMLALNGRNLRIPQIGSFVLAVVSWIIIPAAAALPFADIAGLTYTDSLFETISGFTTTGATLIKDVNDLPMIVILMRSLYQWLGGFMTLMTILMMLAPFAIGGLPDRQSKVLSGSDKEVGARVFRTVKAVLRGYGTVTFICFVLLALTGTPLFYAFTIAMSTLSTGGFNPTSAPLQDVVGRSGQIILIVFMVIGGTSFIWQNAVLKWHVKTVKEHRESYFIIGLCAALGIVIAVLLYQAAGSSDVLPASSALIEGTFNATSLVTTTGFESREGVFSLLPITAIIFIIFVGGGTFSTAGGVKHYRLGGLLTQSHRELQRLIYPHSIRSARFGSQKYDIQLMKAVWSFLMATIVLIAVGTCIVAVSSLSFDAAFMATISSFSNIGPAYNIYYSTPDDPNWLAYSDMPDWTRMTLAIIMLLGRLEILVVFGALNLKYWLNR